MRIRRYVPPLGLRVVTVRSKTRPAIPTCVPIQLILQSSRINATFLEESGGSKQEND